MSEREPAAFQGFSPRAFDFFWELGLHNERPWFQAHKEEFKAELDRPFRALAAQTLAGMDQRFPQLGLRLHVSRIYRDARRLFGRGPYQDNLWFSLQRESRSVGPVFWFEINGEGYSHGVGHWDRTPAQAAVFRRKVAGHPARFEALIRGLPEGYRLWGEPYKRPKLTLGEPLDDWVNRKTVSVGYEGAFGKAVLTPALPGLLVDSMSQLVPLYQFFAEAYQQALSESSPDQRG